MIDRKRCFQDLFTALGRLDRLIERATRAADAAYGGAASTDPYRGLYIAPDDIKRILARDPGAPLLAGQEAGESSVEYPRMARLAECFSLNSFDQDVILLAAAPEIDLRYERLYAYLHDDVTRKRPSVDLALHLLCASREGKLAARERFASDSPLVRNRLIHLAADTNSVSPPLLAHSVKLDDTVLRYLLGETGADARLVGFTTMIQPALRDASRAGDALLAQMESVVRDGKQAKRGVRFYFEGPKQTLKRKAAEALAGRLDAPLLVCDLGRLPAAYAESDSAMEVAIRDALLNDAVLYLDDFDAIRDSAVGAALLARLSKVACIAVFDGERPWGSQALEAAVVRFPGLEFAERKECWRVALRDASVATPEKLDDLAALYRLGGDEIRRAVASAADQARLAGSSAGENDLFAAARAQSTRDLGPLAQRVAPLHTWESLVLPDDQIAQLREIAGQARFRHVVFGDWGFDTRLSMGKGLSALLSGPPGTGKTMAAEVLANDLGLELYKIDLSQVVSKYIGETEKNLGRVFAQAHAGNCILFFDECDALFGKRTEVKDAHDRYANIETAYLLQKIDDYDGLCLMGTNLRQNLDPAFTRRLTFIVDFPFPDEASRKLIWKSIWPRGCPLSSTLDLDYLASRFKLSGGSVKNVAVGAAFLAAAERDGEVRTSHLVRAARRELEKMGRSLGRAEQIRYAEEVDPEGVLGLKAAASNAVRQ